MKLGRFELKKERLGIIIAGITMVIALAVYFVFYAPLTKELRSLYSECKLLEDEVITTKDVITLAASVYKEKVLMTEADMPEAMDELTKYGKSKGINFISINPETIKEESKYKILPIRMRLKSNYIELAEFLGSLDELEKGLVKVRRFNIVPEPQAPSTLITDLTIDMYFSGE